MDTIRSWHALFQRNRTRTATYSLVFAGSSRVLSIWTWDFEVIDESINCPEASNTQLYFIHYITSRVIRPILYVPSRAFVPEGNCNERHLPHDLFRGADNYEQDIVSTPIFHWVVSQKIMHRWLTITPRRSLILPCCISMISKLISPVNGRPSFGR